MNDNTTFGLSESQLLEINQIFNLHPDVKKVVIFGSRAKGNYKYSSDVDLAIINEGVSRETIYSIKSDLDDSNIPYVVDLVYLPEISNNNFTDHITRIGIPFYLTTKP